MTPLTLFINRILSSGTLLAHIFIFICIILVVASRMGKKMPFLSWISRYGIYASFVLALISIFTSLYYSEIVGFNPCKLCWYQRIFMYPQVIILGIVLLKKDLAGIKYSLSLSIIGVLIALDHVYLQTSGISLLPCATGEFAQSCSERFVFEYGYITIPVMSLTSFVLIILFLFLEARYRNKPSEIK